MVCTAPNLAALKSMLDQCKASTRTLGDLIATRDATIRQQKDTIIRLEEELQRLRAA